VYIDDGTADDSGELSIDVNGHEYVEQENFSYDQDGVVDAVAVDTADGGQLVYSDGDHDGTADLVTEYDQHGDVTQQAHYDDATGKWIDTSLDSDTGTDTDTGLAAMSHGTGTVTVDTPQGEVNVGPATVDTDNDGTPDTAVVHDANGDTILYTDSHGTGQADIATELTPDGQVITADHTGEHEWAQTQHGSLGEDGQVSDTTAPFIPEVGADAVPVPDAADDEHWAGDRSGWAAAFSNTGSAQGVVRIDATTGQWISPN
jgi:hypothetical protein